MSESAYYDSLGIPPGGLGTRRRAYFGGTMTDQLSDADLAYRFYSGKMPGVTGSINDLRSEYLRSLGGTGSINDMLNQLYSGEISETPVDPPEPGLMARFNFNDPGNVETFDTVSNRRMALTSFEKSSGYDGQSVNALASTSVGDTPDGFLNRGTFTIAVRAYLASITATTAGGGVRFYAADGTTIVAQVLTRVLVTSGTNVAVVAQVRKGGVLSSAGMLSGNDPAEMQVTADTWPWTFLIYDGALLQAFVGNVPVSAGVALSGDIDAPATMQAYVSATSAKIDDIRVFDYAIDEAKRLELMGE